MNLNQKQDSLKALSDQELMANFGDLVISGREQLVSELEYIIELERRKLFLHYNSIRAFLVEEHRLEEWEAERKIRAARTMARIPELKFLFESGKLNLSLLELALGCAHREDLSGEELFELIQG